MKTSEIDNKKINLYMYIFVVAISKENPEC